MGIIQYLLPDYKKINALITYISVIIILIFSESQSLYLSSNNIFNGIELEFTSQVKVLLISMNVFFMIVFFKSYKKYTKMYLLLWFMLNGALNSFFTTRDFFNIYVHLELISMLIFLLVALDRDEKKIWASLKYMFLSSIAFEIYLIGVAIIYKDTGSININYVVKQGEISQLALEFIIVGLLIKSGFFFISGWLENAHGEAVYGISPILSGVIVKLGLGIIFLIIPLLNVSNRELLINYAYVSSIMGGIFMILENNLKKTLAFSTMITTAYMLIVLIQFTDYFIYFLALDMFIKGFLFMNADDIKLITKQKDIRKIKEIPLSLYIIFFINIFIITGLYPSVINGIKYNLIINHNILFIGYFFYGALIYKLIKNISFYKDINFKHWYMYIIAFSFILFAFINITFHLKEFIIEILLMILGGVFYKYLNKFLNEKNIDLSFMHKFDNTIIYQITILLIILIINA
ncbi:MAG: proton-conducting transporter membrane subunit [Thermotogota bacterium]